jgi:hypothetical protein
MAGRYSPMRLLRVQEPFTHEEFLYEVKLDGFRALAHVAGDQCQLVSRNGHVFKSWRELAVEIARVVRCNSAVLDGEICCLDGDGRTRFNDLLFRREQPYFYAFDVLAIDGEDLTGLPLVKRKRRLRSSRRPYAASCISIGLSDVALISTSSPASRILRGLSRSGGTVRTNVMAAQRRGSRSRIPCTAKRRVGRTCLTRGAIVATGRRAETIAPEVQFAPTYRFSAGCNGSGLTSPADPLFILCSVRANTGLPWRQVSPATGAS